MSSFTEFDTHSSIFLDYLKNFQQCSEHTISAYSVDIEQWRSFLLEKQKNWKEVIKEDMIEFLFQMSSQDNKSRRTQSRKLSSIKSFYNFCTQEEYIERNIFANFSGPKYTKSLPKSIPPVSMSILLEDNTKQNKFIQVRDRFLLEFLYSTGCRISEALALDILDIFDGNCFIKEIIVKGKGKKERVVFLTKKAEEVFLIYFQLRTNYCNGGNIIEAPLFINMRGTRLTRRGANYVLKQRKQQLNVNSSMSLHSFRHSFATDLLNEGADIRKIQELLGHSSVSTTQNYTHIVKERLFEVFRSAHPHAKIAKNKNKF